MSTAPRTDPIAHAADGPAAAPAECINTRIRAAIYAWDACGRFPDTDLDRSAIDTAIDALRSDAAAGPTTTVNVTAPTVPATPSDAEIEALAHRFVRGIGDYAIHEKGIPDDGAIEDFARAVLARWGAPQAAALPAPVGWKLVPDASNMTDEQAEAIAEIAHCCGGIAYNVYRAALAAAPPAPASMKGHEVAALVNKLRDIAVKYHATQQLREQIAQVIRPLNHALALPDAEPVDPVIHLDFKQATELLEMFGGEPTEITLAYGVGHSGKGVYASYTDIPEEGAEYLGISDDEAMPQPATAPEPTDELILSCGPGQEDAAWPFEAQLYFARAVLALK